MMSKFSYDAYIWRFMYLKINNKIKKKGGG